eukprot:365861-Chlamydomonas_euryale.AAC.16
MASLGEVHHGKFYSRCHLQGLHGSTSLPHAGTMSDPNLVGGTLCLPEGLGMTSPTSTLGWLMRISHYL